MSLKRLSFSMWKTYHLKSPIKAPERRPLCCPLSLILKTHLSAGFMVSKNLFKVEKEMPEARPLTPLLRRSVNLELIFLGSVWTKATMGWCRKSFRTSYFPSSPYFFFLFLFFPFSIFPLFILM